VRVRRSISCVLVWAVLGVAKSASAAGEAHGSPPASDAFDYAVADPALRVERLDSSPQESFLAVRVDPLGRVFVGGRESLFVYEPAENGGYLPKKLLFKFPPNSWVYDVEFRGNDLYVLTMSALYLVPDGAIQRTDLHPKRLAWGVPRGHVHQCFHALAWGPEGDLYISMGDPLWYYGDFERADHWGFWNFHVQPEGTLVPYNGAGGVFRCRPDGSRFEVIARGLRNPCGLAFDDHWNLFSNDNDHESLPALYVPGRLEHVTPHSYFSWPRGWMPFKTPDRLDLLDTMTDGLGRCVPVGQSYYQETLLPEKYRNNLLLARWDTREVTRYPLQTQGASFKTSEERLLIGRNNARPVGVCVGRGGRIFVTIAYMDHNDESPVYKSDLVMITRADDSPKHPFDAYDIVQAKPEELWREISDPSWGRRFRAHLEILRRGGDLLNEAERRLATSDKQGPALHHLIWLAAAASAPSKTVPVLLRDRDPLLRTEAIRAMTEFGGFLADASPLLPAIEDPDPRVQHAALLACFPPAVPLSDALREAIVHRPAQSTDTYLRQTAAFLLAQRGTLDRLQALTRSDDSAIRLAGILSAGFRLTVPPENRPPRADLPLAKWHNGDQAYNLAFADGKVDLRSAGRIGTYTVAEHWKAGSHSAEQERLFALLRAQLKDESEANRLEAAFFLWMLNDPRSEPEIAAVRAASVSRRLAATPLKPIDAAWITGPFADGDKGLRAEHEPERGPIDLGKTYPVGKAAIGWTEMQSKAGAFDLRAKFGPSADSSFYAYARLDCYAPEQIELQVGSDHGDRVWLNGKSVFLNDSSPTKPSHDIVRLELQPGGNELICRVLSLAGSCRLDLQFRSVGNVVARLPDKVSYDSLAARPSGPQQNGVVVPKEFLDVDWSKAVEKGDAKRGRKLFASLGCSKCHAITNDSPVVGGPSLAEAQRRFTVPYVVESVLLPSKQISPLFRASRVDLDSGQSFTGLIVKETADQIELLQSDATRKSIMLKNIESRTTLDLSPMPVGLVHSPEELRDLLSYILSDKPEAP
jgi:putative heme-binding domain-containing protein